MNNVFYQTRSVTRHDSSSLRASRGPRRMSYLCNSQATGSSETFGYFASPLDATNVCVNPSTSVSSQSSTDSISTDTECQMSVASLLLDNPADFVVINNVTEEAKPEVITLNGDMLHSWKSEELFEVNAPDNSRPMANRCENAYDFSQLVFDDGFVPYEPYEVKTPESVADLSQQQYVQRGFQIGSHPLGGLPTVPPHNFSIPPPTQPAYLPDYSAKFIEDESLVMHEDIFGGLSDFSFENDHYSQRSNDFFSMHISDLI